MKFNIIRDNEYITNLKKHINKEYKLNIDRVKEASRGVDGETWIIYSDRKKYFVKIAYYSSHKEKYINSINTLNIINKHKIKNINRIIKTSSKKNYTDFNDGILAIYSFVNGSIDYNYPYDKIIKYLVPIYKIIDDFRELKHEDFSINRLIEDTKKNIELCKKDKECNDILNKYNKLLPNYFKKCLLHTVMLV